MGTLFGILPDDVNDKIANVLYTDVERKDTDNVHSLQDSEELQTLLHFAKLGKSQTRAVMTAMDYTIEAQRWKRGTAEEWLTVCADMITKLDLTNSLHIELPASFPVLSELQNVGIRAEESELKAIRSSSKLYSLTVIINNWEIWDLLMDTISALRLKELDLYYDFWGGIQSDTCRKFYEIPPRMQEQMIAACPLVENLTVRGDRIHMISSAMWPVIAALPSLKKLEYHGEIPETYASFVGTLSEVVLCDMNHTDILQRLNKEAITGILRFRDLKKESIEMFTSLENLQKVDIHPKKGAERALVGAIRNVNALALHWDFDKVCHSGNEEVGPGVRIWRTFAKFYKPNPKVLLRIVESAPNLKELKLQHCIVSSATIDKLLQSTGDRLEYLGIPTDWQQEHSTKRLARILWSIARRCKKLRTLKMLEQNDRFLPIFATDVGKGECLQALIEVKRVLPGFLSYGNIKELIQYRLEFQGQGNFLLWDNIFRAT